MSRYISAMSVVLCHRLAELDAAILACKSEEQMRRLTRVRRALVRRWRFLIGAKPPLL